MPSSEDYRPIADRFAAVAQQFCSLVESASATDRTDLLVRIYRILPRLISEAIHLPSLSLDDTSSRPSKVAVIPWAALYDALKTKLADWDGYLQVFDPTEDQEAVHGSLADDVADIYRDLKEGLLLIDAGQGSPAEIIWDWRFGYYSHWGQHAIGALQVIHFRLQRILE